MSVTPPKLAINKLNCFQKLFLAAKVRSSHSFVQIVCPKCTVLSDIATISPLTNASNGTMVEDLPLKYNNLLLLPLNISVQLITMLIYCEKRPVSRDNHGHTKKVGTNRWPTI